ncbi:MAG: amidohydrolase family protein [Thermodesulfobacteriota bacterium]
MKVLHRAPLVVPVLSPPLEDGAVLVENGVIVAVDRYAALQGSAPVRDHEGKILTPPLANCHTHLELSHLGGLAEQERREEEFTGWIRRLLEARASSGDDGLAAGQRQLAAFRQQGVAWLADIGNLPASHAIGENGAVQVSFFLEMLGLGQTRTELVLAQLDDIAGDCTAHAPYSVSARLLQALKARARQRGRLFPIHVAESAAEIRFLHDGGGPLRDFVEERGVWDNSFVPPGCGAVTYLDRLGMLDDSTVCVHCVHLTDEEIDLLAARSARVCLCPASNRFLGVGRARVARMLAVGLQPCLGTDSAASNPLPHLWEEMRILHGEHPGIDPAAIFRMATLNGARLLGVANGGMLAPGSPAFLLAVEGEGVSLRNVQDFLVAVGSDARLARIDGKEEA